MTTVKSNTSSASPKIRFWILGVLCVYLYQMAGTMVVFSLQRHFHRQQEARDIMHHKLQKATVTFHLHPDDIEWMEPGKELRYRGALYDVVSIQKESASWGIVCISDTKEDALVANFQRTREQERNRLELHHFLTALYADKDISTLQNILPEPLLLVSDCGFPARQLTSRLLCDEPAIPPETL